MRCPNSLSPLESEQEKRPDCRGSQLHCACCDGGAIVTLSTERAAKWYPGMRLKARLAQPSAAISLLLCRDTALPQTTSTTAPRAASQPLKLEDGCR